LEFGRRLLEFASKRGGEIFAGREVTGLAGVGGVKGKVTGIG